MWIVILIAVYHEYKLFVHSIPSCFLKCCQNIAGIVLKDLQEIESVLARSGSV